MLQENEMTKQFKDKMEAAIKAVREAQMEIENEGTTYEILDNVMGILEDALEDTVSQ